MGEKGISRAGFLIALAAAVLFGVWPASVRGIYAEGGNIVFTLLALTWMRTLAMVGFCLATKKPLFATREATIQALIGGVFQTIALVTIYASLEFLPGPIAIIIIFSHTLMLLFFMAWRREIRLYTATVATTVAALIGLSLVVDVWHLQSAATLTGIALAFASALATVSRLYVYGQQTKTRHPIIVGAESFLVASILLIPTLLFGCHWPNTERGIIFAAMGCTAVSIATFAMFYGIGLMGSFQWSLLAKMEPVFTSIFSALLLGEILKSSQYFGMLIVISSLALYQLCEQRRIRKT